jgi:hypothetical protein
VLDVRLGYLQYKVDVLPFDYGTRPAAEIGIPGLNLDDNFTSGLPAMYIGDFGTGAGMNLGSSLAVNACNCPLAQDEKDLQAAATSPRRRGTTPSSSAWTSGGPTTSASRATGTARAKWSSPPS